MSNQEQLSEITLILDNGGEIVITYPDSILEEIWAEIMQTHGWWYCGNWTDLDATYRGQSLDHINMERVVGVR